MTTKINDGNFMEIMESNYFQNPSQNLIWESQFSKPKGNAVKSFVRNSLLKSNNVFF